MSISLAEVEKMLLVCPVLAIARLN